MRHRAAAAQLQSSSGAGLPQARAQRLQTPEGMPGMFHRGCGCLNPKEETLTPHRCREPKRSVQAPELLKEDMASVPVVEPTVMADGAEAGENRHASLCEVKVRTRAAPGKKVRTLVSPNLTSEKTFQYASSSRCCKTAERIMSGFAARTIAAPPDT